MIWLVACFFLEGYYIPKAWFIGIFYALHNDSYVLGLVSELPTEMMKK